MRAEWAHEWPGLDTSPIDVVARTGRLARYFDQATDRVFAVYGLRREGWDVLASLRRAGPPYRLTTREIAQRALVTAGAVSQRVAKAEREGLVRRAAAGDGSRAVNVTMTRAGHALVERSVDRVLGREAELVRGLAAAERADLTALLDRLLAGVAAHVSADSGPAPR